MPDYEEDLEKLCPERHESCVGDSCAKYVKIPSLEIAGCAENVQARVLAVIVRILDR